MSNRGSDGVLRTLEVEADNRPIRIGRSDTSAPNTDRQDKRDVFQSSSMSRTDVNLQHLKR